MKRISIFLAALLLTVALCGTIYAKYIKGFVVVNKTEDSVIIKDKNDVELSIKTKPSKFKIGDEVKYDEKRKKLRLDVEPEGC